MRSVLTAGRFSCPLSRCLVIAAVLAVARRLVRLAVRPALLIALMAAIVSYGSHLV
jgi:hypothetical protein